MRRLPIIVSASILALGLSSTAALAFNADLPSAPAAPKIDAQIDAAEWSKAADFPLSYAQIDKIGGTALSTITGWPGPAVDKTPGTGDLKMMWDAKYLYISGKVVDTVIYFRNDASGVGSQSASATNNQDTLQVCLDPLADGETANDANIIDFTMSADASQGIYWQHWGDPRNEFPNIQMKAIKTATGYQFEAAVPWSDFAIPYAPKKGDILGYGGLFLDADDGNFNELYCDFGAGENVIGTPPGWNRLTLK